MVQWALLTHGAVSAAHAWCSERCSRMVQWALLTRGAVSAAYASKRACARTGLARLVRNTAAELARTPSKEFLSIISKSNLEVQ